jgi:hypothetical protein
MPKSCKDVCARVCEQIFTHGAAQSCTGRSELRRTGRPAAPIPQEARGWCRCWRQRWKSRAHCPARDPTPPTPPLTLTCALVLSAAWHRASTCLFSQCQLWMRRLLGSAMARRRAAASSPLKHQPNHRPSLRPLGFVGWSNCTSQSGESVSETCLCSWHGDRDAKAMPAGSDRGPRAAAGVRGCGREAERAGSRQGRSASASASASTSASPCARKALLSPETVDVQAQEPRPAVRRRIPRLRLRLRLRLCDAPCAGCSRPSLQSLLCMKRLGAACPLLRAACPALTHRESASAARLSSTFCTGQTCTQPSR